MNVADKGVAIGFCLSMEIFMALLTYIKMFAAFKAIVERNPLGKLCFAAFALASPHPTLENH